MYMLQSCLLCYSPSCYSFKLLKLIDQPKYLNHAIIQQFYLTFSIKDFGFWQPQLEMKDILCRNKLVQTSDWYFCVIWRFSKSSLARIAIPKYFTSLLLSPKYPRKCVILLGYQALLQLGRVALVEFFSAYLDMICDEVNALEISQLAAQTGKTTTAVRGADVSRV